MMIRRARPAQGKCFAWTPKQTSEGWVWLEWVHYQLNDTLEADPTYWRFIPQFRYDAGERWQRAVISCAEPGSVRYDPPDISKCRELRPYGPCRYPHCTCMNVGGSTCACGEPPVLMGMREGVRRDD